MSLQNEPEKVVILVLNFQYFTGILVDVDEIIIVSSITVKDSFCSIPWLRVQATQIMLPLTLTAATCASPIRPIMRQKTVIQ